MVDLMIGRVGKQLKAKDMTMELTDKAKSLLAKRGFDPVLGARPLRRTIQREIEDALSEKILFDEVGPGQLVTVDVENWDGEGAGEDAVFTFVGHRKPAVADEAGPGQAGAARQPRPQPSNQRQRDNGRSPSRVPPVRCVIGGYVARSRWAYDADVIDGRRNLVKVQNGRATVKVRPDAVTLDTGRELPKGHLT